MNERAAKLYDALKNSFIWEKVNNVFNEHGKGLTEEDIRLYVFVIDSQGPENLEGIHKQYSILEEITNNNFGRFREVYDNLEAFLRKILYVASKERYDEYRKSGRHGLKETLDFMNAITDDYNNKPRTGKNKVFASIMFERNENSHNSPVNDLEGISNTVWQSIFTELWVVRMYASELNEASNKLSDEEYKKITDKYALCQILPYEEKQERGFKYIQIEYENAQDPEQFNEDEVLEIIRGTADTLLQSINFEQTPSIKLVAEAGMGKTMMMDYLNYKLSRDYKDAGSKILPIKILCNDTKGDLVNYMFKDTFLNKLRVFLDENGFSHVSEKGFWNYISNNYTIMFLIDGLNEINKSASDKSKFIKSLRDFIGGNRRCYFITTERFSRGAITLKDSAVFYKLSEISDDIKKQFFNSKGAGTLFKRLEIIQENYDSETQKELNVLLKKPFYISVFCELADSLNGMEDSKLPKNKQELMDFFVRELVKRENAKGEMAANYMYVRLYLGKLAELSSVDNNRILVPDALKAFAQITQEYGLNNQEYSSNHIIELFEQLGFIRCSDDKFISIEDVYADYMDELLLEML